ncbi:hypothetical protein D4764_19G0001130 [Takifugu flavidus]|uniref:Uncharacterized protein n=1 Tax=Takifugu flavidus TaxID=433684 RepID=A0A5C6NN14_9TELE|nr:hypothetical protein D4764_19G0001130 [Takifugu flavidus]
MDLGLLQYQGCLGPSAASVPGLLQYQGCLGPSAASVPGLLQYQGCLGPSAASVPGLLQYQGCLGPSAASVPGLLQYWGCFSPGCTFPTWPAVKECLTTADDYSLLHELCPNPGGQLKLKPALCAAVRAHLLRPPPAPPQGTGIRGWRSADIVPPKTGFPFRVVDPSGDNEQKAPGVSKHAYNQGLDMKEGRRSTSSSPVFL